MRETWELSDLPPRFRAQAEAQIAADVDRKARRRLSRPSTRALDLEVLRTSRPILTEPLLLDLPIQPWSLNDERSSHWRTHRARTEAAREVVATCVRGLVDGRFALPVEVLATPRGVRHDPGNSYPTVKAAIDGLVDAGILDDDTGLQVRRVVLNAPVSGEPGLILCVRLVQL